MPAGEWGSEGISNLCCPGRPAAVCSTARGEMSSHLEEIRMENIHVKNKRIKIAIQKKKRNFVFCATCTAHVLSSCSLKRMAFTQGAGCQPSGLPAAGSHPIGHHPTVCAVTPPTCCSCFSLTAQRGLFSLSAVPGLWKCFLCHSSTSPAA